MKYLTAVQVLDLHKRVVSATGGSQWLRDAGGLASAVSQPAVTFGGMELYETVAEKAAALGFSLVMNHPFVDGNKRIGHAAMVAFLQMNGHDLEAPVDEQECVILDLAAGKIEREDFVAWVAAHIVVHS